MPLVKTFSVGDGDTYYIQHGSDNFTVIDCNLEDDRKLQIVDEIIEKSADKEISRFISTHPDDDHYRGIDYLDARKTIVNFYCVANKTTKDPETDSFKHYKKLRDGDKQFTIYRGCSRKWMNESDDVRGSSGINILWPNTDNKYYKEALNQAAAGGSPNNISIVATYSIEEGPIFSWFGDLETEFMENIYDDIALVESQIVFAPHHGRKSGRLPQSWLDKLKPKIIVLGEAPSAHLEYYSNFNTIKQNSAGDVVFETEGKKVHVFCSEPSYSVDFLSNENQKDTHGYYIGTLNFSKK
ncbi:hypothetical protein [Amylibacter sp. IMCC11727]|uniref:hypothetical protein n=1 Tax=Amylibacter sp. IMCC11727 TaxID=3039851 RepID=UPI00244E0AE6|nr:hypothetical protein [Amylibacter sp. IMCC11727]WGI22460.1 hypothetical protein QBD29_03310 [Amylibacter sp. IMCC11727]